MNHPSITPVNNIEVTFPPELQKNLSETEIEYIKQNKNFRMDPILFNLLFEKQQEEIKSKLKTDIKVIEEPKKKLHEMTFGELVFDYKNNILELINELVLFRFNNINEFLNIFLKNNRLLHLGITIIIIAIFLYLLKN